MPEGSFNKLILARSQNRSTVLIFVMLLICMDIAFCHLSEIRMVEPTNFYSFNSREPFVYRMLIPLVLSVFHVDFMTCKTQLNFPISSCADLLALCIDWSSLAFSCIILIICFRKIKSNEATRLHRPEIVVPVFMWMVIFNYMLVPNRSIYYPYDFLELSFLSVAVWLGVSGRGGYWGLPLLTLLSSLNKETALFLPVVYTLYVGWRGELTRRTILIAILSLLFVFVGKYFCVFYITNFIITTPPNDPSIFENHLFLNITQMANPIAWLAWLSAFGGAAIFMILPSPRIRNLKIVVSGLILTWILVIFFVGITRQIRLMGPMIYPILLPVMLIIEDLMYSKLASRSPEN